MIQNCCPAGTHVIFIGPDIRVPDITPQVQSLRERIDAGNRPRAVILAANDPRAFSKGVPREECNVDPAASLEMGWRLMEDLYGLTSESSIPVIALISGFCIAGGMELVLHPRCIRFAFSEDTCLLLPEFSLGVLPGWNGANNALSQACYASLGKVWNWIISGAKMSSVEAQSAGLVDYLVPGSPRNPLDTSAAALQIDRWISGHPERRNLKFDAQSGGMIDLPDDGLLSEKSVNMLQQWSSNVDALRRVAGIGGEEICCTEFLGCYARLQESGALQGALTRKAVGI